MQVPVCLYPYACFLDSKTGETSKRRKGAKNSETAAKVALMKLKMHAAGDKSLPQVGFRYLGNKKFQIWLEPPLCSSLSLEPTKPELDVYHF